MSETSSIFDGIENAKVSGAGNWVQPGRYTCEITAVKLTKKFTGEQFLAVEMTVKEVLDSDSGHKVGEEITHLMKVTNPGFLGNVKQFVSASLGCSADDVGKAEADRVTSDEQPLAGFQIGVDARQITTKAGKPFTKVIYKNLDDAANAA